MGFLSKILSAIKNTELDQSPTETEAKTVDSNEGKKDGIRLDEFGAPKNGLEAALFTARREAENPVKFLEVLLNSTAYILVPDGNFKVGEDGTPRLVDQPVVFYLDHKGKTICIYTHVDRTKSTTERFPDFKYAIGVRVGDLLSGIEDGLAVVLNPFCEENFYLSPEHVRAVKANFGITNKP